MYVVCLALVLMIFKLTVVLLTTVLDLFSLLGLHVSHLGYPQVNFAGGVLVVSANSAEDAVKNTAQ